MARSRVGLAGMCQLVRAAEVELICAVIESEKKMDFDERLARDIEKAIDALKNGDIEDCECKLDLILLDIKSRKILAPYCEKHQKPFYGMACPDCAAALSRLDNKCRCKNPVSTTSTRDLCGNCGKPRRRY
jgi:hypothetical protein